MLMLEERKQVVDYCRKLSQHDLTKGTGGNISIYNDELQLMAISPTGVDYFEMEAKDVVVCKLDGEIVDGDLMYSSEFEMHAINYRKRNDIKAIIHTHSTYAASLSCLRLDLPAVDYLVAMAGGNNVRCAKYASYGSKQLAINSFEAMQGRKAVLLANHGITCGSQSIEQTFAILVEIEFCCQLYLNALSAGVPIILDDEEMNYMLEKFEVYGQVKSIK